MEQDTEKVKCPVCDGSGLIQPSGKLPKDLLAEKANVARKLKESGYSIREIMRIMNYKSPHSISVLLEKDE